MLMITDTVLRKSCYNYATPRHTSCKCGLKSLGAGDEIKKQVENTPNKLFFLLGKPGGKNNWLQQRLPFASQAREHYKNAVKKNTHTCSSGIGKTNGID